MENETGEFARLNVLRIQAFNFHLPILLIIFFDGALQISTFQK